MLREYEIKDAHTQKEKEAAIFHKDLFSVNLNAHKIADDDLFYWTNIYPLISTHF